jgi:hypothetical protein
MITRDKASEIRKFEQTELIKEQEAVWISEVFLCA